VRISYRACKTWQTYDSHHGPRRSQPEGHGQPCLHRRSSGGVRLPQQPQPAWPLVLQRWIGAPDFQSEWAGTGLTSLKRKRGSKMLIIQCPSLALQACGKRLPRHRWHSRRRLIQRRSINWRDAASAACDCFAGVLGTRPPDHARDTPGRRAIPACGNLGRALCRITSPARGCNCHLL